MPDDPSSNDDDVEDAIDELVGANDVSGAPGPAYEAASLLASVDDIERFSQLLKQEGWEAALEAVELDDSDLPITTEELDEALEEDKSPDIYD